MPDRVKYITADQAFLFRGNYGKDHNGCSSVVFPEIKDFAYAWSFGARANVGVKRVFFVTFVRPPYLRGKAVAVAGVLNL